MFELCVRGRSSRQEVVWAQLNLLSSSETLLGSRADVKPSAVGLIFS